MTWSTLLQVLGAIGGPAALVAVVTLGPTVRKARAAARRADIDIDIDIDIDVTVAEDTAEDAHWRTMLEAQVELVVRPLREEIGRLGGEVKAARADAAAARSEVEQMRSEVTAHRTRYWRAITYIRALLALLARHAPHATAPTPPVEIQADI